MDEQTTETTETQQQQQQENGQHEQDENGDTRAECPFQHDRMAPKKRGIIVNEEEVALEAINQELMEDPDYAEVENLQENLQKFKEKFLEFDKDDDKNIDMFGLTRMMEKLGQTKTHLEIRKMIKEIDRTNKGTICYRDFIAMMLGPKNSVLKLILLFEQKTKDPEKPTGVAPKRDLASLP